MDVVILKGDFAGRNVKMSAHVRIPHVNMYHPANQWMPQSDFFRLLVAVFSCLSVGVGLEEVGE